MSHEHDHHHPHTHASKDLVSRCFVLTVSDTRTAETDVGGRTIREAIEAAGHRVVGVQIVPDDPEAIREVVSRASASSEEQTERESSCDVLLITGGTGISARDRTPEAVQPLLDFELPGFGELFRLLSYREIGSAAMLSRALAGVRSSCVVFAIPGSVAAVKLALDALIIPELGHLKSELAKHKT